jgi:hypothetical protein
VDRSSYQVADGPADIALEECDDFRLVRPRLVPVVGVLAGMRFGEIRDSGRNDGDGEESSKDGGEPRTRSSGQRRDLRRRGRDIGFEQLGQRK